MHLSATNVPCHNEDVEAIGPSKPGGKQNSPLAFPASTSSGLHQFAGESTAICAGGPAQEPGSTGGTAANASRREKKSQNQA